MPTSVHLPSLSPLTWALVYFAAYMIGVSKTGLPGVGIIGVLLFTLNLPPLSATGSVLLLLIGADILAVTTYRRHAEWSYLKKLFPFTAIGVIAGTIVMKWLTAIHAGDKPIQQLIGGILLLLVAFQLIQRYRPKSAAAESENAPTLPPIASVATGILAGFTTMVANAAGPIMVLYLLAMRLPKIVFVGTAAWFFFTVNLFKVPFGIYLGSVTWNEFVLALCLYPGALLGGFTGKWLLSRVNQTWFERIALAFTIIAGIRLCWP